MDKNQWKLKYEEDFSLNLKTGYGRYAAFL